MVLAGVGFYNNNIPLSTLLTPAAFVALCFGSTTALKASESGTLSFSNSRSLHCILKDVHRESTTAQGFVTLLL